MKAEIRFILFCRGGFMTVGNLNAFQEALESGSLANLREAGYFISRLVEKYQGSSEQKVTDGLRKRWGELLDAYIAIKPKIDNTRDLEDVEREIEHLTVLSQRS
jgi:hypothetical protein